MGTKTKNNSKNSVALAKHMPLGLNTKANFYELYNQDQKEVDKKMHFHQNRQGKKVQLLAAINNLQMKISKAEIDYTKSLVSPTTDSISLAIDIKALGEELKIAEAVYLQLFPQEKSLK
jgi:hypothetical protein